MDKTNEKILLIVEDNPADITQILRELEDVEHDFTDIISLKSIAQAKEFFLTQVPSCCLLDCNLIDGTATKLLEEIENQPNTTLCPFIIITEIKNSQNAVALMKKGVMDYLTKPISDGHELIKVINSAEKTWNLQNQLNFLALHDPLTKLINRTLFVDRLTQLFKKHDRTAIPFSLIYIDLDEFKLVNDQYGHEAGDFLLEQFSIKMTECLRDTDSGARLGGDEFGILLPNTDRDQCINVAHKLMQSLCVDLAWNDQYLAIKLSIGIACCPGGATNHHELMREADFALYQSKKNGRGQYSIFDHKMEQSVLTSRAISSALSHALETEQLSVFYQPIFDSKTFEVVEVEALVRWYFNGSWIPPEKIINYMMEQNLSEPFHKWLFNSALKQLKQWKHSAPNLTMAINLPANLPSDNSILRDLENIINSQNLAFKDLIIEITEFHFMQHPIETKKQLFKLKSCNAKIAIDDFGTGFSSMQYLGTLPCNQLKIDKSFFLTLLENKRNEKIIKAITSLAQSLELESVAEGIESEYLVEQANKLGCQKLQGFWLGAPVAGHANFNEFLILSKKEGQNLLST